ncbi:hypothetical protein [Aromatoleum toluvorans]|uniref:hypothetical protein n=1 Tax=Aromatoleum toluvorans TaxID=92002 RepID=UPI001FE56B2E|nr:hypothetical protein [Aromatoleum toluvorans]
MTRATRGSRPGAELMGDLFDPAPAAIRPAAHLADLPQLLQRWVEHGWLRPLDRAFAQFLRDHAPDAAPLLLLAAALASHQLGRGHVCLDLAATLADPRFALSLPPEGDDESDLPPLPDEVLAGVTLADWQAALDHPLLVALGAGNTPLVRVGTRLYLRRYGCAAHSRGAGFRVRQGCDRTVRSIPR